MPAEKLLCCAGPPGAKHSLSAASMCCSEESMEESRSYASFCTCSSICCRLASETAAFFLGRFLVAAQRST